MYLELLENNGVNIKKLALEFLSKKLQQPECMIYLKLSNPSISEEGVYDFEYSTTEGGVFKTTHHFFEDFGYHNNYEDSNILRGEFNPEWLKIIYREMIQYLPTYAEDYMNDARDVLKEAHKDASDCYNEEYEIACRKAEHKLNAKVACLNDYFNKANTLIDELDINSSNQPKQQ